MAIRALRAPRISHLRSEVCSRDDWRCRLKRTAHLSPKFIPTHLNVLEHEGHPADAGNALTQLGMDCFCLCASDVLSFDMALRSLAIPDKLGSCTHQRDRGHGRQPSVSVCTTT